MMNKDFYDVAYEASMVYWELFDNLQKEIPRFIFKGIHQTIKHFNEMADDNDLITELLQEDVNTLVKYDIRGEINGQA